MGRASDRLQDASRRRLAGVARQVRIGALLLYLGGASGPTAAAPAPPPPTEAVIAAIPFLSEGSRSHVIIDLAAEGQRPFPLMLDTGAAASVITPALARQMSISVRRTKDSAYRRPTRLGRDLLFTVDTRYGDSRSFSGWQYGLLGADFLDDYVVEIDYPARVVRFLDPDRYEVPESVDAPDERVVPFVRAGTRILVDFELEGKVAKALLDTGAGTSGVLSGAVVERAGIDVDALPEGFEMQTTVGVVQTRLLQTTTFRFAGFPFERVGLLVAPRGVGNIGGPTDSVLGHGVLSRFALRIDYPRRRIWLRRSAEPVDSEPRESKRPAFLVSEPTDEERQQMREDAERRDALREQEWEERQASRRFVHERGGWQVVEGHRLRRGPKPGEVWLTYDEMMEVERAAEEDNADPATAPAGP